MLAVGGKSVITGEIPGAVQPRSPTAIYLRCWEGLHCVLDGCNNATACKTRHNALSLALLVHGVNGSLDTFIEQQPTSASKLQYTCPATRLLTKDKGEVMAKVSEFYEVANVIHTEDCVVCYGQ
jgi:hypothetical protein